MKKYIWNKINIQYSLGRESSNEENKDSNTKRLPLLIPIDNRNKNLIDISTQTKNMSDLDLFKMIGGFKNNNRLLVFDSENNEYMKYQSEWCTDHYSNKNQRISSENKLRILKMYMIENKSYSEIANELMITYSSIYRIIQMYKSSSESLSSWFKSKPL